MGSLKFSQQYGNNKISVNQNQKVVTIPVGVVEPGDKHFIGVIQEITEEKFICSASELSDLIECIKGCNAEVGDEVIICLMHDGQYVVVARVGGDLGGGTGGGVPPEYGSTTDYIAGKVFAFAGNLTPAGCLLCDGREVSRSEYWELFAAIGTLYGAGDGSTTFNLPNIESRTIIGESDNYTLGTTGGEETHTLTAEEAPEHWHSMSHILGAAGGVAGDGTILQKGYIGSQYSNIVEKENSWRYTTDVQGGNQPHNNMQPYIVMRYFITTGKGDPVSGINPADYVMEWGKTGIWTWRKYASGLAECWGSTTFDSGSSWPTWGEIYYSTNSSGNIEYPFEFIEPPAEQVTLGQANLDLWLIQSIGNSKTATGSYYGGRSTSANQTNVDIYVDFYVVGEWKKTSASGGTETIAPTIAEKFDGIEAKIEPLVYDSGWLDVYVANNLEVRARKVGSIVYLYGYSSNGYPIDPGKHVAITTLPVGWRPKFDTPISLNAHGGDIPDITGYIAIDGILYMYSNSQKMTHWRCFTSYPVD